MKEKILLTGSGGFIGKNILKEFSADYEVLHPRSFELNLSDAASVKKYLKKHSPSFILHAAVDSSSESILETNLSMFNSLAAAMPAGCKMINFGSGAEYGKQRDIVDITEGKFGQVQPADPYGLSKYLISKEIEKRDNIINLRLFGVYGKYEDYTRRFISYALYQNINKRNIEIRQNAVFSYLYVKDLCGILKYFLKNWPEEKNINIVPDEKYDLLSIAETVNKNSPFQSKITTGKDGFQNEYSASNALLRKLLPDFKFTSLQDGIKELRPFLETLEK